LAQRNYTLLHVFPSFAMGGQQRRLAALVGGLGDEFRHRICALDGDLSARSMMPDGASAVAYKTLVLEKSSLVSLNNVRRLRRLLLESQADLLCTYNFGSIEAVIANRAGPNLPHVHHEDGFGPDEASGRQKAKRVLARRFLLGRSLLTTPSTVLEKIAIETWRIPSSRVRRVPVGIDVKRYRVEPRRRDGAVTVGALGALRREKNFKRLIRCFSAASEGRSARLVIYGEGPERPALERARAASPAGDRIFLPGATFRPEEALAEFDIFALSSDTEQTPISLMEAMAAGLPSIATDVGDVRLMVGDEGAEFIIAPDNDQAYAARLGDLIDDAGLRARLGEAARKRAPIFDQSAMIAAFRALYLEAIRADG
jgi:glycosyltransferase involved in cell wall biosynthesis